MICFKILVLLRLSNPHLGKTRYLQFKFSWRWIRPIYDYPNWMAGPQLRMVMHDFWPRKQLKTEGWSAWSFRYASLEKLGKSEERCYKVSEKKALNFWKWGDYRLWKNLLTLLGINYLTFKVKKISTCLKDRTLGKHIVLEIPWKTANSQLYCLWVECTASSPPRQICSKTCVLRKYYSELTSHLDVVCNSCMSVCEEKDCVAAQEERRVSNCKLALCKVSGWALR